MDELNALVRDDENRSFPVSAIWKILEIDKPPSIAQFRIKWLDYFNAGDPSSPGYLDEIYSSNMFGHPPEKPSNFHVSWSLGNMDLDWENESAYRKINRIKNGLYALYGTIRIH